MKKLKSRVMQAWGSLSESTQDKILTNLSYVLNYIGNSVLLSIPVTFFLSFFMSVTFATYLILVVCNAISLSFFESYYVWVREDWKKEVKDNIQASEDDEHYP